MKGTRNIYLIGLMGVGKTTIGRQLAKALNLPFYDSDKVIEENTGVDIPTIFEFEGEAGFRVREEQTITELTSRQNIVLATGGGAVIRNNNRAALAEHGFVVYLQCSVAKILQRTRRDTQRPLLKTAEPRAKLEELFALRDPLYQSCADYCIDTGIMQSRTVVKKIINEFQAQQT